MNDHQERHDQDRHDSATSRGADGSMDRNQDESADHSTGDAGARAGADGQGTPTGSHDNTGYPHANTSVPQGTQVPMSERTGQPGSQEQTLDQDGSQSGRQDIPSGQRRDDGETGQPTGNDMRRRAEANADVDQPYDGPRPSTGRPADQGEEFDEAEGASTEHGNEGSGWHGGGRAQ